MVALKKTPVVVHVRGRVHQDRKPRVTFISEEAKETLSKSGGNIEN